MPRPNATAQLTLCLLFHPDTHSMIGTRIRIAASMPDRANEPSTFLTATLCDVMPDHKQGQIMTYRFVVDAMSLNCAPVQRALDRHRAQLQQASDAYNDDDPIKALVNVEIQKPAHVWLQFAASDWIVALGDTVTVCMSDGISEPLGRIFQLSVTT